MSFVDSHCHLDYVPKGPEREAVIARARSAGVKGLLTISTKITEFDTVRTIAESDPNIWCSVGIHPHEAASEPETNVQDLVALATHPKVIGIGETGLDFYYSHSPRDRQEEVFRAHAAAARQTGLPLIVHTRDADPETIRILQEETAKGPLIGLIHCFSTGRELAETAIELGFYISLSGIVTFKNADKLREIVQDLPLDRILIETDAPYLSPVPLRGKVNEPSHIIYTAEKVADLKGLALENLGEVTTNNFLRLFAKAAPSELS